MHYINANKIKTTKEVNSVIENYMRDIDAMLLVPQICLIEIIRFRWRAV